jgi:hypothetical protein
MPCIQLSISHFYPPNQLLREAEPTPFWAQENRFFHGKRVSGQGQTGGRVQNQARTAQGTLPFSDMYAMNRVCCAELRNAVVRCESYAGRLRRALQHVLDDRNMDEQKFIASVNFLGKPAFGGSRLNVRCSPENRRL